jgi:hypothetical protein
MKKLLLAVLVSLGLQTQAQINYCDSLSYSVVQGTQTLTTIGDASPFINMVDSIVWNWQACNATMCYSGYGDTASFGQILTTDTVKVCYDAYIYYDSSIYICSQCDSLVYDANSYSWVLMNMGNPLAITELQLNTINDGKIYDMLGRELNEIPIGTMYIRNKRLYITK